MAQINGSFNSVCYTVAQKRGIRYRANKNKKGVKMKTKERKTNQTKATSHKPTKATAKTKPTSRHNHLVLTLFDTTIEALARAIHTSHKATIDFRETKIECCDTLIPTENGVVFIGTAKQAQSAFDRQAKGIIKLQPTQRKISIHPVFGKKTTKE